MLFTYDITATVGSSRTKPDKETLKLRAGTITLMSVMIPPGQHAKGHLVVKDGETTIIPWGDGQDIHGNYETLEWEPKYKLLSEPAALRAEAWNEGSFPHTFYLRIWVDPKPPVLPLDLIVKVLNRIDKFLGRVGF